MPRLAAWLLLALLAGCQRPPPSAFVGDGGRGTVALGDTSQAEACTQDEGVGGHEASIYCGTAHDYPAAHVTGGEQASAAPAVLATTSAWRRGLDGRATCAAPEAASLLGSPAVRLDCAMRRGGFPYTGIVAVLDGRAWYADGIAAASGPMERSIGVLSGRLEARAAAAQAASPGLAARRAASAAFSAGDLGRFRTWRNTARYANNAGDYAEAEQADRSIELLQARILGPDAPALAGTLADEAVQTSNLGHYETADRLLDHAARLAVAPGQPDANAPALIHQDRGLNLLNEGHYAAALAELQSAETDYAANAPPGIDVLPVADGAGARSLPDPSAPTLFGLAETRRAKAVALRHLGRLAESARAARSAQALADAYGLAGAGNAARLLRTSAFVAEAAGEGAAAREDLSTAALRFADALPDSATYGQTALLLAAREAKGGDAAAALRDCRAGIAALRSAGHGAAPDLLLPCLSLMDRAAVGAAAPALRGEMFEAAELAQGTTTSREIAEVSARLSTAGNPRLAGVLRDRADLTAKLDRLIASRQAGTSAGAFDQEIAATQGEIAAANAAIEAASPRYASLVQNTSPVGDVRAAFGHGEAFVSIMLGSDAGWSFLLSGDGLHAAPIPGGARRMAALVTRVRASLGRSPPPPFDTSAAAELYDALLRPHEAALAGVKTLIVAPAGPLFSIPFALLLTGPAAQDDLAAAPWLVQRVAVAHVPAPANFVSLRKLAARSAAPDPWFGFGEVVAPTLAQAQVSYPAGSCEGTARRFAGLPPLAGAKDELDLVGKLTRAAPEDALLGAAFTREAVMTADLGRARLLHFATHAVLPNELPCLTEPAIVVSTPRGAHDASASLLTASNVTALHLDADAVLLSACNTGGAEDGAGGESLSGLARSFFYAGARSVLVTHWPVNDAVMKSLVGYTVHFMQDGMGSTTALAEAQRKLIGAARGERASLAHPFFWAPLAVIGAGSAAGGHVAM